MVSCSLFDVGRDLNFVHWYSLNSYYKGTKWWLKNNSWVNVKNHILMWEWPLIREESPLVGWQREHLGTTRVCFKGWHEEKHRNHRTSHFTERSSPTFPPHIFEPDYQDLLFFHFFFVFYWASLTWGKVSNPDYFFTLEFTWAFWWQPEGFSIYTRFLLLQRNYRCPLALIPSILSADN